MSIECLSDAAYVLGALTPAERAEFEQHVAGCERCQISVRALADMPGLLSIRSEDAVTAEEDPVPSALAPDLLPELLRAIAGRKRRRTALLTGLSAVAAACAALLIVVLAVRPAMSNPAPLADQTVQLRPAQPGSAMSVTVQLSDKQWGTAMTVLCSYSGYHVTGTDYRLVLVETSGRKVDAGSWGSVDGASATVPVATNLQRSAIASMQVQRGDGSVVASAPVTG